MSYTTIRTAHSVGDIVFFYDSETDTVQRGVVVGIEARNTTPGYSPEWDVVYSIAHKFAADPPRHASIIGEKDVKANASDAFPPLALDEPAVPEAA